MRKRTALWLCLMMIFGLWGTGFSETAEAIPAVIPYGAPMDATIRVLLQSLGQRPALGLTLTGSFSVDGDRGFQFEPDTEIKLGVDGQSIALKTGGVLIDMGSKFTLMRHLDDDGNAGGAYIHESERDTLFCGDLTFSVRDGSLRVVVAMDIEEYLYGVVAYEMSEGFPLEALKAQAVAARTYAMQRKARNASQDYDIVDTTNDQVFKGFDARYQRPIQAVDETRGIVGRHGNRYADCVYSASNGGQTALATDVWGNSGDYSYLDMRDDPYDLENPDSVVKSATILRDATLMDETLYGLLLDRVAVALYEKGELEEGEAVGLAEVMAVEAENPVYGGESRQYGDIRFTVKPSVRKFVPAEEGAPQELGDVQTLEEPVVVTLSFYQEVRGALNIAINPQNYELVEAEETDEGFVLTVRRYGHGVGMSQRGAEWMAKEYGMTYLEILHFYYPGLQFYEMAWIDQSLTHVDSLPDSLGYAAPRPTPRPTPAPLPPLAEGEYYALVSVEGVDATLNVREAPTMEATIVDVIRNGARLIVMEEMEGGWARMKTAELSGYVSMTFIAPENAGESAGEGTEETMHVF